MQSIALQVPKEDLVEGDDPVIGVWATASRMATRTLNPGAASSFSGDWVQVSRLGNPLVNEVVVPLKAKDAFNSLEPSQDATTLSGVAAPPLSTEGPSPWSPTRSSPVSSSSSTGSMCPRLLATTSCRSSSPASPT